LFPPCYLCFFLFLASLFDFVFVLFSGFFSFVSRRCCLFMIDHTSATSPGHRVLVA
jgi:hypothetical protein